MIFRWGAVAVSLCLVGGCTWAGGDGRDRNPANQPGYYRPAHTSPHRVAGDVAGADPAFRLVNGADVVRVRVADLDGDSFQVSTPDGSKIVPTVSVSGGEVVAGVRDSRATGPAVVEVVLDSSPRWRVVLAGGAADETVDLSGGPGGDVEFSAGVARAAVVLPPAVGTRRVVVGGGASQVSVRLGGDQPVRLVARGGAGSITVDGQTRSGIAGGAMFTGAGWEQAADRYDIDATSGVGTVIVARG